jgi:NitT/TauT family transport system substrate-binding protein
MMTRRGLLGGMTVGLATGILGEPYRCAEAEPPPETKKLTLALTPSICQAPQYVAEALLKTEGFADVRYVKTPGTLDAKAVATGEVDITLTFVGPVLLRIDAGDPVVLLGGGHIGCIELVGHDTVRAVRDLKGKRVLVYAHPRTLSASTPCACTKPG